MRIAPAHDAERSTNKIQTGRALLSMNSLSTSRGDASPLSDIRPVQMTSPPRNCNAVHCHKTIFDLLAQRNDNDGKDEFAMCRHPYMRFQTWSSHEMNCPNLFQDNTFVIHRKLLRRRHVRKEQMRRQREAAKQHRDALLRKTTTQNATDDAPIRSPVSLSALDILVSMASPCNTHSSDAEQSMMHFESENIRSMVNDFRATTLPFSPLRPKRRKLDMLS